jgi:sulfite reductase alpha subunit-like flavoprotein
LRRNGASACPALIKAKGVSLGSAMLFFGCRHPDQDYLYADELKALAADGITELHTAFSRTEAPETYVQNLVAAQQEEPTFRELRANQVFAGPQSRQ